MGLFILKQAHWQRHDIYFPNGNICSFPLSFLVKRAGQLQILIEIFIFISVESGCG